MKMIFLFLLQLPIILTAVTIPQSSLEALKNEMMAKLAAARRTNDQKLVGKYQKNIEDLNKKIARFEQEWLNHRKNQLELRLDDKAKAELNEINELIKERA